MVSGTLNSFNIFSILLWGFRTSLFQSLWMRPRVPNSGFSWLVLNRAGHFEMHSEAADYWLRLQRTLRNHSFCEAVLCNFTIVSRVGQSMAIAVILNRLETNLVGMSTNDGAFCWRKGLGAKFNFNVSNKNLTLLLTNPVVQSLTQTMPGASAQ